MGGHKRFLKILRNKNSNKYGSKAGGQRINEANSWHLEIKKCKVTNVRSASGQIDKYLT